MVFIVISLQKNCSHKFYIIYEYFLHFYSCTCRCMSKTNDFYCDFTKFLFAPGNVKLAYCFSNIVGHVDNGHTCMNPSFEKLMKLSLQHVIIVIRCSHVFWVQRCLMFCGNVLFFRLSLWRSILEEWHTFSILRPLLFNHCFIVTILFQTEIAFHETL